MIWSSIFYVMAAGKSVCSVLGSGRLSVYPHVCTYVMLQDILDLNVMLSSQCVQALFVLMLRIGDLRLNRR